MEPGIEVRGLIKRYRKTLALSGIDFSVAPGEVFALLGPNGAGKTTTLRILAGLIKPSGGHVRVAGADPVREPMVVRHRLGYVSGGMGLYERLTGEEVLSYFGRLYGLDDRALHQRIAELDAIFSLGRALATRVEEMSSGMKQKVLVARAFLHRPRILLLDEPTQALDVFARRALLDHLETLKRDGRAVLYSTHVLPEAEEVADRVGFLHRGRLVYVGRVEEAKTRFSAPTLEHAFIRAVGEVEA